MTFHYYWISKIHYFLLKLRTKIPSIQLFKNTFDYHFLIHTKDFKINLYLTLFYIKIYLFFQIYLYLIYVFLFIFLKKMIMELNYLRNFYKTIYFEFFLKKLITQNMLIFFNYILFFFFKQFQFNIIVSYYFIFYLFSSKN